MCNVPSNTNAITVTQTHSEKNTVKSYIYSSREFNFVENASQTKAEITCGVNKAQNVIDSVSH